MSAQEERHDLMEAENKRLRAALVMCRDAIRVNLVRYAFKDEQVLHAAFTEAEKALRRKRRPPPKADG